jgi:hypothetical protein
MLGTFELDVREVRRVDRFELHASIGTAAADIFFQR